MKKERPIVFTSGQFRQIPAKIRGVLLAFMAISALSWPTAVLAAPVTWTDWTSAGTNTVAGSMTFGSTVVGVTFSGPYYAPATQTSGGTNYWTNPSIYTSTAVDNAPPDTDIIALFTGGSKTITFSQAVLNPVIALVSWNYNTVDFGVPITILSYGHGYWGSGTPTLNFAGTGFYGSGEVHGTIQLPGVYSSITFTDISEGWHGFTVGASAVPVPGALWLLGSGLVGLVGIRRKRNQV